MTDEWPPSGWDGRQSCAGGGVDIASAVVFGHDHIAHRVVSGAAVVVQVASRIASWRQQAAQVRDFIERDDDIGADTHALADR